MTLLTPMNALRLAISDICPLQSQRSDKETRTNADYQNECAPASRKTDAENEWWLEFS